jgi:uncharacterized protein involved in response to NO
MSFPSCRHRRKPIHEVAPGLLNWLAAEPFRVFFVLGVLWSMAGVLLWPLWHLGRLTFYPGLVHARLMIECFGGAFVAGFLGTAGPGMVSAPKLRGWEFLAMVASLMGCGSAHLGLAMRLGDSCFLLLLGLLSASLILRWRRFLSESPPPQMVLAIMGLLCGMAGSVIWLRPDWMSSPAAFRMAGLLVHEGFLLLPVLGVGSFFVPRVLGGQFGEPKGVSARRWSLARAVAVAAAVVGSFAWEACGHAGSSAWLRAAAAGAYLLSEVPWRPPPGAEAPGTLSRGLFWALGCGWTGIVMAGSFPAWRIGLSHLLYIGGFGLLMLIIASRVLCGHSGQLNAFSHRGWIPRLLVAAAILAATTRASADVWPKITRSHHLYAAILWSLLAILWLAWHRRRFLQKDSE